MLPLSFQISFPPDTIVMLNTSISSASSKTVVSIVTFWFASGTCNTCTHITCRKPFYWDYLKHSQILHRRYVHSYIQKVSLLKRLRVYFFVERKNKRCRKTYLAYENTYVLVFFRFLNVLKKRTSRRDLLSLWLHRCFNTIIHMS